MIDPKLLAMLRCPADGSELAIADEALLRGLNESIQRGVLRDRADQKVDEPIEFGLVTADQKRLYVVRGGIPALIVDQAIEI